jgi:hypothetical protein
MAYLIGPSLYLEVVQYFREEISHVMVPLLNDWRWSLRNEPCFHSFSAAFLK